MNIITPDKVNAGFEIAAALFIIYNCFILHHDKLVRGISPYSYVLFTAWSIWNMFFYPIVEQTFSFYAATLMAIAQLVYTCMLAYYTIYPNGKTPVFKS